MRVDKMRCDRCGFEVPNPAEPHIFPVVLKMRRAVAQEAVVDASLDLCLRCFGVVQAAVTEALKL